MQGINNWEVDRVTRGVPTFSEQEKERAKDIIRQNPKISLPELARRCSSVSESSLARWRKEIQNGTGDMGQEKNHSNDETGSGNGEPSAQPLTKEQRLRFLEQQNEDYLRTIRIQQIVVAYLRRYCGATEDDRKDIEIEYLIALLAEYGCVEPERLSIEEPLEGE
jgi:transposase-like protein